MSGPPIDTAQFASLYVGDLHPDVAEVTLFQAFSEAGPVASCRVCRDSVTRRSLGYAYVNYLNVADAERALETLNYMSFKGKPCRVMWSQRDPSRRKSNANNICVKNLDPTIDNKALHDTFSIFGNILSCKVSTDIQGRSRGYGFVHYEAEEAAQQAIAKVNGMRIGDSTVSVSQCFNKEVVESTGTDTFTNLYVKNMPPTWDDAKVDSVFGEFGEVMSSVILTTDEGRRFALVNFKESAAAQECIKVLHRKDMRSEMGVESSAGSGPQAEVAAEPASSSTSKSQETGAPGICEVTSDEQAPAQALEDDHPAYLLYVQRAQTRAERKAMLDEERQTRKGTGKGGRTGIKLCIRNIAGSISKDQLRDIFEPFGTILATILREDEVAKRHKGVGFVVLSTPEEANLAIQATHGKDVAGKALNVCLAEKKRRGEEDNDMSAPPRVGGKAGGRVGKDSSREGQGKGKAGGFGNGKGKGGQGQWRTGDAPQAAPFAGQPPAFAHGPPPFGFPMGCTGFGPLFAGFPGPFGMQPPATFALQPAMAAGCGFGHPGMLPGMPVTPFPGRMPMMLPQAFLHPGAMSTPMFGMAPAAPLSAALTREAIEKLPKQAQKQLLGERLFGLCYRHRPDMAGKLTGMMLELDNKEIFSLLESEERLKQKIKEALEVLLQPRG